MHWDKCLSILLKELLLVSTFSLPTEEVVENTVGAKKAELETWVLYCNVGVFFKILLLFFNKSTVIEKMSRFIVRQWITYEEFYAIKLGWVFYVILKSLLNLSANIS